MLRVFVGHDPREEVGSSVFLSSMLEHASCPIQLTHLHTPVLEDVFGKKFASGTNAFTRSRFLVAALCDFAGPPAVFVDGADMICKADISQIVKEVSVHKAVSVVKHEYKTKNPRKYVGTMLECLNEDYPRKQWASVFVVNPSNFAWRRLTPDTVSEMPLLDLLQFKWVDDSRIGELSPEWNWLVDEQGPNEKAKILHWTAGIPAFKHYRNAPHSADWHRQLRRAMNASL